MGTNGCPQGALAARPAPFPAEAMPTAPGWPGRPPDLKPFGNQGNRAPDRLTPVTAQSDMRRRLTAPARTGHPPQDRDRVAAGPARQAAGAGGDGPTWPWR